METRDKRNKLPFDNRALAISLGSLLIIFAVFSIFEAYPQPAKYFAFADTRKVFNVANFWNVATNIAFLGPGLFGLTYLRTADNPGILHGTRSIYGVLFCGVVLTAFGSSWFHLQPDNESLVWDRLPMTIVFMSLTAAVIAEYVSVPAGRKIFLPLLIAGIASVVYWAWTESQGAGDLRLYGLVQFLPMLLIPAIALLYQSAFDRNGYLLAAFLFYAIAKIAEHFDSEIFLLAQVVSGHSLKHIIAAFAPLVLLYGIMVRRVNPQR